MEVQVNINELFNFKHSVFTRSDLYVTAVTESSEAKTDVVFNVAEGAIFDQTFSLTLGPNDKFIRIQLWNQDLFSMDLLLAETEIHLNEVAAKEHVKKIVKFRNDKGKKFAKLFVEVIFFSYFRFQTPTASVLLAIWTLTALPSLIPRFLPKTLKSRRKRIWSDRCRTK